MDDATTIVWHGEYKALMQRCPHCQFPVAHKARMCGWCGTAVRGGLPFWLSRRQTTHATRHHAGKAAPSSLIGIPGMGPLVTTEPTRHDATTMPAPGASGLALHGSTAAAAYPTVTLAEGWPATITLPSQAQPTTSALPYTPAAPLTPPPPQFITTTGVDRWWPVGLLLLPLLTWALIQNDQFWSDALQTATRICFMGGAIMSVWLLYRHFARGHAWERIVIPAIAGLLLVMVGGLSSALAQPAAIWQGQQATQRGEYAQAIAIYAHAGDTTAVARTQMAWGNTLIDQNDFVAARQHLTAGLTNANGQVSADGHAALGRLYWRWGQSSLQAGKVADARAQWTLASVQAAGTTDGDRAAAALAAPQSITGHVIWLGEPMPALHIALISSWQYMASTQSLQSSGDRLEAITGDDGTFTISGAKPGVTYALIWVGTFGDTTRVDAQGKPLYTVKVRSLESTDIGTIDIGTPMATTSGNAS